LPLQKVYWSKLQQRTSLIWGRKQASKSRRHREPPSKSIKIGQHPKSNSKTYKNQRKRENPESSSGEEVCNLQW